MVRPNGFSGRLRAGGTSKRFGGAEQRAKHLLRRRETDKSDKATDSSR